MAISWFIINKSDYPKEPTNYIKVNGQPSCCGNTSVCAIRAKIQRINKTRRPVIDDSLFNEIIIALASNKNTENVILGEDS